MSKRALLAGLTALACAGAAIATETMNYRYDGRGRLVRTEHIGAINNGVIANYAFDDADNLTNRQVTGAP